MRIRRYHILKKVLQNIKLVHIICVESVVDTIWCKDLKNTKINFIRLSVHYVLNDFVADFHYIDTNEQLITHFLAFYAIILMLIHMDMNSILKQLDDCLIMLKSINQTKCYMYAIISLQDVLVYLLLAMNYLNIKEQFIKENV